VLLFSIDICLVAAAISIEWNRGRQFEREIYQEENKHFISSSTPLLPFIQSSICY